jgi:hypothetical protein
MHQLYGKVMSGSREPIPDTFEPFTADLISAVDPQAVDKFLQTLV